MEIKLCGLSPHHETHSSRLAHYLTVPFRIKHLSVGEGSIEVITEKNFTRRSEVVIKKVFCFLEYNYLICENGDTFYTNGGGNRHRCRYKYNDADGYKSQVIKCFDYLKGSNTVYCINDRNQVFTAKLGKKKFKLVETPKALSIACGTNHYLLLDEHGQVFSCGLGSRGQLGLNALTDEKHPKLVTSLRNETVVRIACGAWHSACLTDKGELYMWGWNDQGQLGTPAFYNDNIPDGVFRTNMISRPINIRSLGDLGIKVVVCGQRHTVLIDENNAAWTFGYNKYGQLGRANTHHCLRAGGGGASTTTNVGGVATTTATAEEVTVAQKPSVAQYVPRPIAFNVISVHACMFSTVVVMAIPAPT